MVEIWRYRLQPLAALNAMSSGIGLCHGALIRSGGGYGCIHPWPSLGDAPIDEQLARLARNQPTSLGRRALDCCSVDGVARRQGQNLFEDLEMPRSHVTVGSSESAECLARRAEEFYAAGFDTLKIKTGSDVGTEAVRVNTFGQRWRQLHPENKIRLDFNFALSAEDFRKFVAMLPSETLAIIDFVEDPCPYDRALWQALQQETGLRLALDRGAEQQNNCDGFAVRVWKPTCSPPPTPSAGERIVVTSYMDHAIGQVFAAFEAARFPGEVDICGLLTHSLFAADPFFEKLGIKDARLVPPLGPGLGFGAMLEALPWKPLT